MLALFLEKVPTNAFNNEIICLLINIGKNINSQLHNIGVDKEVYIIFKKYILFILLIIH